MDIVESIAKVLGIGLLLGAGLPAVFAVGLRLFAQGSGDANADGTVTAGNPLLRGLGILIFVLIGLVIVVGILWICRSTIDYYFDIKLFPFGSK